MTAGSYVILHIKQKTGKNLGNKYMRNQKAGNEYLTGDSVFKITINDAYLHADVGLGLLGCRTGRCQGARRVTLGSTRGH